MGNVPSRHPKAELYPYLGYGSLSPASPRGEYLDEKDAVFQDILDQPLVVSDHGGAARRRSWASSARSSTRGSGSRRISFDAAFDAARDAWERVLPPRRRSYHKVYESERGTIGIEWAATAARAEE